MKEKNMFFRIIFPFLENNTHSRVKSALRSLITNPSNKRPWRFFNLSLAHSKQSRKKWFHIHTYLCKQTPSLQLQTTKVNIKVFIQHLINLMHANTGMFARPSLLASIYNMWERQSRFWKFIHYSISTRYENQI